MGDCCSCSCWWGGASFFIGTVLEGLFGSKSCLDFGLSGIGRLVPASGIGTAAGPAVGTGVDFTFGFIAPGANVRVISFNVGRLSGIFGGFSVTSVKVGETGGEGAGWAGAGESEFAGGVSLNNASRAVWCVLVGLATLLEFDALVLATVLFRSLNASRSFIVWAFNRGGGSWEAFGTAGPLAIAPCDP